MTNQKINKAIAKYLDLTAEKTAEIIERDGSVITGFVVTDKYGNVGIIDKGAVKWIDKAKFYGMMQGDE
jgi:predicted enzyme involved in methoxymalonyl-ACP biosynthesis